MDIKKYHMMPNATISESIASQIEKSDTIHTTPFDEKNNILSDTSLQSEVGIARFPNGDYLVSMVCPMPNVTKEMIDWWFWWHPQADERYQLWFPGEHYKIGYSKKNRGYFSSLKQPAFQPNTQYPTEKIGNIKMPLEIDFVSPNAFGFDENLMKENDVATIVCGHVGAYHNLIQHTEMAHIFIQKENGLFLVSRFWLGKRLKNKLIRKVMLTDETAKSMACHCCVEYRNLAMKLSELYSKHNNK